MVKNQNTKAAPAPKQQDKNKLVELGPDEKGTINISTIGKNKVQCDLTAKPNSESPVRYQMRWTFDFSNCTPEEIQEIAANYVKIRMQDFWRKQQNYADASWNGKTFDVKTEILERTRVTNKNPVARASKLIDTMSDEQKAELLKQLTAKA